jgi:hypothetical protein
LKIFICNIFGLLALLFSCALPAYAAGPGANQGSGGYRGSGGYHRSGGYQGSGGYHGSSGYHGSGSHSGHGGHNGHGNSYNFGIAIGPGWGGWGPGWWGPPAYPYYPYYPYYQAPPVVIGQQPQAYVQQNQQESDYWYYCQNPQGYYPYIKSCPGGWMKVVPDTVPPGR